VAVEAALVLPLLCLLVFGMVEFSLVLRDYVTVTSATRSGDRIATASADAGPGTCETGPSAPPCTSANSPALAQQAADAIESSLNGVSAESVQYVLVFQANSKGWPCATADDPTMAAGKQYCTAGTVVPATAPTSCSGYVNCVKFVWSATTNAGTPGFRYSSGSWDSRTINACLTKQQNVGIYLATSHKMLTGFFGSTMNISDKAVGKFEPLSDSTCSSLQQAPHA
jgi:Flp pilus assembly protein TadG